MSAGELRTLIDAVSTATEEFFAEHGAISPGWYVIAGDGTQYFVRQAPGDKDKATTAIRAFLDSVSAKRYVFVAAGRLTIGNKPRVENVMFSGEDHEAGQILAMRRIMRPRGAKPYLAPLKEERTAMSQGRFIGLLPVRGTKQ